MGDSADSSARPDGGGGRAPESLTLLVAEADADTRAARGLALGLRGFRVAAEAADAASAIGAAVRELPDLCLIHMELPGNGLSAVAQIAARVPATTIVVLARSSEPDNLIAALERGASGYLLQEIGDDELAKTLRAAHAGEPALSRSLVPLLVEHVRRGSRRRLALPARTVLLTPREWEVAELVQAGLQTEEVAATLGLSPVTVRRHLSSLRRKSGASSREALVELLKLFAR